MTIKPYEGWTKEYFGVFAKHDRGLISDRCGPDSDWADITLRVAVAVSANLPPANRFERDSGFRCNVTLFNPGSLNGSNEYGVFACVHGRTMVRVVRTGAKQHLTCWAKEQVALVMHTWGFACDCIRPAWQHHFHLSLSRRTITDLRDWVASLQAPEGGFRLETEWAKRVGPLDVPWRRGDGTRQFRRH